jgi:hypothetical protein
MLEIAIPKKLPATRPIERERRIVQSGMRAPSMD